MLKNCPKCNSSFIEIRQGISQCDRKGEWYTYEFCIMCSFTRHVRNAAEQRDYVTELTQSVGETLQVNTQVTRRYSSNGPSYLGPN